MTGPRYARPQPGGGRKYVWGNPTETFDSVTSVLRVLNKPALLGWATRMCGEYVRDNFGTMAAVMRSDPQAVVQMVKQAPWSQRDAAAERGTFVHALAEAITLGQTPRVPDALKGYVSSWAAWRDDFAIEFVMAEATGYNRADGTAGTMDVIVKAKGLGTILIDYKTGKDVYPDAAKQLTAYRTMEFVGMPDGVTELPMPEVEGTYVLRLAEDDYDMVPVRSDASQREAWAHVLALFRDGQRSDLIGASIGSGARLL